MEITYLVIAVANFLLVLVGGGVAYGKLVQKNNTTDKVVMVLSGDVKKVQEDLNHELINAVKERNEGFVRKEVFDQFVDTITKRMDAIDNIKIEAQLAELKAMLMNVKEMIKEIQERQQ